LTLREKCDRDPENATSSFVRIGIILSEFLIANGRCFIDYKCDRNVQRITLFIPDKETKKKC